MLFLKENICIMMVFKECRIVDCLWFWVKWILLWLGDDELVERIDIWGFDNVMFVLMSMVMISVYVWMWDEIFIFLILKFNLFGWLS